MGVGEDREAVMTRKLRQRRLGWGGEAVGPLGEGRG